MSGWRCGRTYCKLCGELHVHSVEREDKSGYPVMVRCRGCGGVWGPWPSAAEFRERAVLRNRARAKRWRLANPERHRENVRLWYQRHPRRKAEDIYEWATCPTCGQDFIKSVHNQRYCCVHCRDTSEHRRAYMREYQKRRTARNP